ncbi:amidohydrolase family protein [Pararobbsia silviterrae]|uniref:Amidohydrolase n=1 Tax=Pararobbsia silviterrae TaxID=1792498 RepID=A0A494X0R0_9BURK|nr:amidohydrolase family protein [Pararobbsia silviterrae]RKP43920.1 amidohydrolase [Pararobbsia silviterrae]
MKTISLDVHAHLAPIDAQALARIAGVQWQSDPPRLVLDGHAVGLADLFFPDRLLQWMDTHAVQRALISVPPPLYRQQLDAEAARQWADYLNDGLVDIARTHSARLSALLHLPAEHPDVALQALERHRGDDIEGVALAAGGDARIVLSNEAYAPLWQALDDRGAFVFLHPGACADGRLGAFYLENLVGNPLETSIAASHLVMAGVPARYPRIRFCLAHAGGAFTSLVGRLERGFDTKRPGVGLDVERPLLAAARMYADCIGHHPGVVQLARVVFGSSHVLFGSDWPFPMGLPDGMPADDVGQLTDR